MVQPLEPVLKACSSPDLAALLTLAGQGDAASFDSLCQALEPRLMRQAKLLCGGDISTAEDLCQETLTQAWVSLSRFNGRCQFFTWLCAILHHRYGNLVRRRRFLSLFRGSNPAVDEEPEVAAQYPDPGAWPDQVVQAREQAALVRHCLERLPANQQRVIYLRFFVDASLEGIAAALHCSVGTVKSRLFHALEKLRRMPALREGREPRRPEVFAL